MKKKRRAEISGSEGWSFMVGHEDVEREGVWVGRMAGVLAQGGRNEAVSFPSRLPKEPGRRGTRAFAIVEDDEMRGK
jgi:hypothetical protein